MFHENYLKNHFEPSLTSWGKIIEEEILSPSKHKINILSVDFDNPGKSASEIMWLYSLGWLTSYTLLESFDKKVVIKYLSDFLNGLENEKLSGIYRISSFDHCAASRIRYLCMIFSISKDNEEIKKLVIKILDKEINWFSNLSNVAQNNHGMMLCISVFHAAIFLGKEKLENELNNALTWLEDILDNVVPENGYVAENTIGYHDFYYKFIKNQLKFFDEFYKDVEIHDYLHELFKDVELALFKVVTPQGNIPPLGQCGFYPTKYKSIEGTHFFKEQGFLVRKDNENYFSYTCGSFSDVHKQLDNTSIYLKLENQEIFIDSGLGTYNEREPRSAAINGQRGHTGAFFKALDNEHRHLFLTSKELKDVNSSIELLSNIIDSNYNFKFKEYTYSVSRKIIFESFYSFSIIDRFISNNKNSFPVSRFILPFEVNLSIESNVIFIEYPVFILKMEVVSSFNYAFKSGNDNYEESNFSEYWRSLAFNHFEKCKAIEIYPLNDELKIIISIEKKS